jgi:hypothetical protein
MNDSFLNQKYDIQNLVPKFYLFNDSKSREIDAEEIMKKLDFRFAYDGGFWRLVDKYNKSIIVYAQEISFHSLVKIKGDWFGVLGTSHTKLNSNGIPCSDSLMKNEIEENMTELSVGESDYFRPQTMLCGLGKGTKVLLDMTDLSDFYVRQRGCTLVVVGQNSEDSYHDIYMKDGLIIGQFGAMRKVLNNKGEPITGGYHSFFEENGILMGKLGASKEKAFLVAETC